MAKIISRKRTFRWARNSFLGLLCPAIILLITEREVQAWGRRGHPIVARIAELNLPEATNTKLKNLLNLAPSRSISRTEIAMWADEIKSSRPFTKPWHYVDIPVGSTYDAERDCDSGCVVEKIEEFMFVLSDPTSERADRQEAAKFLIHFVGDLHQPLHAAERDNDRGGNAIKVKLLGKQHKLHEVWDEVIVLEDMEDKNINDYAKALNDEITATQRTEWLSGAIDPEAWANESNAIAKEKVYAGVPTAQNQVHPLPDSYATNNRPVVRTQLKKAGLRLAHVLKQSLGE